MGDEVMRKEQDCFAYKNGKCKVLKVKQCEGVDCSFLKTSTQLQMDRLKAFEHVQSLDADIRNEIMAMYNLDDEEQFIEVSGGDS